MMTLSARLDSLDDLRKVLLPPCLICVAPKTITAEWFLDSEVTPAEAQRLTELLGLRYGDGDGLRVAFHPKTYYTTDDIECKVGHAALTAAMSGPCRQDATAIWRVRNQLYDEVRGLSVIATSAVMELPTIAYPEGWLNEKISKADVLGQLYRATREAPDAFRWVDKFGLVWVNVLTALRWWRARYRTPLTMHQLTQMLGEEKIIVDDGVRLKYRAIDPQKLLTNRG
jgi:hypothetical protein